MRKWTLSIAFLLIVGIGVGIGIDVHIHQRRNAFMRASTAMAKSINILNDEPNVDMTGFASNPTTEKI